MTDAQWDSFKQLPGMQKEGELSNGALLVRITGRLFRLTRGGYLYPVR